eukprot:4200045-Amphidinium_carterae.1
MFPGGKQSSSPWHRTAKEAQGKHDARFTESSPLPKSKASTTRQRGHTNSPCELRDVTSTHLGRRWTCYHGHQEYPTTLQVTCRHGLIGSGLTWSRPVTHGWAHQLQCGADALHPQELACPRWTERLSMLDLQRFTPSWSEQPRQSGIAIPSERSSLLKLDSFRWDDADVGSHLRPRFHSSQFPRSQNSN